MDKKLTPSDWFVWEKTFREVVKFCLATGHRSTVNNIISQICEEYKLDAASLLTMDSNHIGALRYNIMKQLEEQIKGLISAN
jgi:hypothetical protein